jgi:hypothetical protein
MLLCRGCKTELEKANDKAVCTLITRGKILLKFYTAMRVKAVGLWKVFPIFQTVPLPFNF